MFCFNDQICCLRRAKIKTPSQHLRAKWQDTCWWQTFKVSQRSWKAPIFSRDGTKALKPNAKPVFLGEGCLIKGTFLGMQAAWLCVCLLGTCFWVIPRQVTNSKSKSGSKNANALANRTHTDARWYESMFVTHMRCEPDDTNKKAIHEPELRHTTFHHIKSRTNTFHWTNISHQNTLLSIKIRGWTMFWPVLHTPLHRVILHVDAIHYIGFHCPLRHYILILTYKTQRIYTWFANYQ